MTIQLTKGDLARRRRSECIKAAFQAIKDAEERLDALDIAARATGFELKETRHLVLRGRVTEE